MDGPNVNWRLHADLGLEFESRYGKKLLNIGSCGLHVVHNAFKNAVEGLNVGSVLTALHRLLDDTPARREDFVKFAYGDEEPKFPLPFCNHRWLENVSVCTRAIEMHDAVRKYVHEVDTSTKLRPKTKSYATVREWLCDPLGLAKMYVFRYIAGPLEKFLTDYQTDKPMVMFLSDDLEQLLRLFMGRFLKDEVLKGANSVMKLLGVDHTDVKLQKSSKSVDVGFSAENELKEKLKSKKVSERDALEFRLMCRDGYAAIVKKLKDNSPVTYSLVRNLRCLDPRKLVDCECSSLFRGVLTHLVDSTRLNREDCDELLTQFKMFNLDEGFVQQLTDFSKKDSRLDTLFCETMGSEPKYAKLWAMVRKLLLLSHGQSYVERGFSVNKDVSTDNLSEPNLVAKRIQGSQHIGKPGISAEFDNCFPESGKHGNLIEIQ
jgi:hypothetical protein